MKKVLAMLFLALSVSASFAQTTSNVVRWKTIVGNITVSNNDAVAGVGGRARVNLATGRVSFDVDGLVLNGGNATGTRGGVDQVEGSLICDAAIRIEPFSPRFQCRWTRVAMRIFPGHSMPLRAPAQTPSF